MSFTVHSKKTSISRLEKAPIVVVAPTSTNLGINTTCASPDEGGAVTLARLEKTFSSAGSSSAQAILPTSKVSLMVAQDPFVNLVLQNSGVRTSVAVRGSFVSDGGGWALAVGSTAGKKSAHNSKIGRASCR